MQTLAPLTELEAINIMLSTIGEAPINSLTADQSTVDVGIAQTVLREISIRVQEEGWQFNTEINWELNVVTSTSELQIPLNCIQIDTTGADRDVDVAMRGQRLYDRKNHTFKFDKSLLVNMVLLLDFTELPQAARHYINIRAARVFQQRVVGSELLGSFTARDEMLARASLKKLDSNNADHNILSGSWSVARILTR
tara:strand:- start:9872 stop:10459 length:588 start_codon:yes stop_codon:yes gene_type:complete